MAEFAGTESHVEIQKRLRDRQGWIAGTPGVANGGRLLHFVEPERLGWDKVCQLAHEDNLAGFPSVSKDETIAAIHEHLGAEWKTPCWDVFLGTPDQILPACADVIHDVALPGGWRVDMFEHPNDDQINAVQALNAETGVSPYPAYYSRGEAVPIITVCISDETGEFAATASATDRYHADSRLAGTVFAGMVSVSPAHRRKGLGKLVNAVMLAESHKAFKWALAKEQVAADNSASRAMIAACGLNNDAGLVSIGAINSDERFTR